MKPFCLTIAGSDPTSGAGIQADIRTFDRCGVYPFSVITAITYQTASNFYGYKSLSDELDKQLDVILSAYPIKYVKIGMIPDPKAIDMIVDYIKRDDLYVIYDPVSISSVGERLSSEGLELEIERDLFPYVRILTPNLSEASFYSHTDLNNLSLNNIGQIKEAAKNLLNKLFSTDKTKNKEKAVIIKGIPIGNKEILDLVCINKKDNNLFNYEFQKYKKAKLTLSGNVHGTGCVFSSAVTAFLAKEYYIKRAIEMAEKFFDEKFQNFIELPDQGKLLDLTVSKEINDVIYQIKEIYNFISSKKEFSKLIPEVRMNISGSLPNATSKREIAGIEGRITIINGYPRAIGAIKFGVSDHTARLILSAKEFDKSINFVTNLKYDSEWIEDIEKNTDLELQEIIREDQSEAIKKTEFSTMQWLIKESVERIGRIPDVIWDKGAIGKEPMMRLFGRDSKDMIKKLRKIIELIT